jgi:hypothetical protein
MAWTTPLTAVANAALTAAQWNASVRDNFAETVPAKATAAGQMFVATGANAVAARVPTAATIDTSQSTTTTATFGDLATVGPVVASLNTGAQALVGMSAQVENSVGNGGGLMAVAVSGSSTIAAIGDRGIRLMSGTAGERNRASVVYMQPLTSGVNTFTAKYTTPTGGTAAFQYRQLFVLPF